MALYGLTHTPPTADAYRCAGCSRAVPDHRLRASAAHPLGEAECPHCGARLARIASTWRPWLQSTLVFLGVLGVLGLLREWPEGTWWPYALVVAGSLLGAWMVRKRPDRVLLPVAPE